VHLHAKLPSGPGKQAAHVGGLAEPQPTAVLEPSGEGLSDVQAGPAVAGGEDGGVVEERAKIEDLEYFGVRPAKSGPLRLRQRAQDTRQLTTPRSVQGLEQPPLTGCGQSYLIVSGNAAGQPPPTTRTARYSSITTTALADAETR
jgi:hypothetical protein